MIEINHLTSVADSFTFGKFEKDSHLPWNPLTSCATMEDVSKLD